MVQITPCQFYHFGLPHSPAPTQTHFPPDWFLSAEGLVEQLEENRAVVLKRFQLLSNQNKRRKSPYHHEFTYLPGLLDVMKESLRLRHMVLQSIYIWSSWTLLGSPERDNSGSTYRRRKDHQKIQSTMARKQLVQVASPPGNSATNASESLTAEVDSIKSEFRLRKQLRGLDVGSWEHSTVTHDGPGLQKDEELQDKLTGPLPCQSHQSDKSLKTTPVYCQVVKTDSI